MPAGGRRSFWNPPPHPGPLRPQGRRGRKKRHLTYVQSAECDLRRDENMRFGLFGSAQARRPTPGTELTDSSQGFREWIENNVEAATLDLLSGGRLDFGVGKGYRYNEFAGFCVDMEEADARFDESLEVITRAFTNNAPFSHRGHYWQYDNIVVEPPPAQRPHPPFWMGAGSKRSVAEVARRGYNLLLGQYDLAEDVVGFVAQFRADVEARGRASNPMEVGVARAVHIARDKDDLAAAYERRFTGHMRINR